jgi:hypothetical protein
MIAASLVFGLEGPAFAGTATGNPTDFSVAGYNYAGQAYITTCNGCSTVGTNIVGTTNYVAPPAGYEESRAYIYFANGALCTTGGWVYNSNGQSNAVASASPACGCNIAYYASGIAGAFNGSGYQTGFTPRTPNQTGCVS